MQTRLLMKKKKLSLNNSKSRTKEEKDKVRKFIANLETRLENYLALIEKFEVEFNEIIDA